VTSFIAIGLFTGFIYSLVALGYTLVYGILRLINFAHSEIFMCGAFGGYFYLRVFVNYQTPPSGAASVFWIGTGILVSGAIGGIMAIVLERFAYRPLRRRNAPPLTYLISAIGASYFLIYFVGKEFGYYQVALPQPYTNGPAFTVFGAEITTYNVIVMIAAVALLVFLDVTINHTKLGRGIRAVAQDTQMASLMGVNIDRTIATTFFLGGVLGGAAGFLFALSTGVSSTMGFVPALYAFTAAVLGGIGNIRGAMLGGLVLGIVQTVPIFWLQQIWYTEPIAFAVLIMLLIFRPTGLLGERLGRTA
jgi:branched-chain amino acid transport system permease protein